jgi:phosphonatase-like hydrolase
MAEPALVIFDLGGTTIRDTGLVPESLDAALQNAGFAVTPTQLSQVRGASKREAIRLLIEALMPPGDPGVDSAAEAVYQDFITRISAGFRAGGVQPIPGVEGTFAWLKGRGIRIAFNTGFDRAITALALGAVGWDQGPAAAVVCGDDVTQGRPAPYMIFHAMEIAGVVDVAHVAAVGDTVLDLQAGTNAGLRWTIGVLSGAHSRTRLEAVPHTHLLPSVADLPSLWPETP